MTSRTVAIAFAALALTLGVGFAGKNLCTTHAWDGYQYRTLCYNDILSLYSARSLADEPIPYIHGNGELDDELDANGNQIEVGDLEYPAGTGLLISAAALQVDDGVAFFRVTSVFLAMLGIAAFAALARTVAEPRRLLFFALGSPLALYAFHNWDLLAVTLMCGGLMLFARGRDTAAGALIGLGAAAKLFPGIVLPAMIIARYRRDGRVDLRMPLASAAAFVVVNLPFLLINPAGWLMPWKFQSTRFPNFETHWYMLYRHLGRMFGDFWFGTYPRLTGVVSTLLFAGAAIVLLRAELRRTAVRPYATAFGLMLLFLLTGKVYSPQFALWLLPFFALVRMPVRAFIAFAVTDLGAWAAVAWFLSRPDHDPRMIVLEIAVFVRYAVLAWLLLLTRTAEENVAPIPVEAASRSR